MEDKPTTDNRQPASNPEHHTVIIVGGGRSSDWAATELYDAGKRIYYIMRRTGSHHWQLINDSRHGLPYYTRIAEILESGDSRFEAMYGTRVRRNRRRYTA